MSWNTFGRILRFTTWGESHGPAIGAVVDGCPPGLTLSEDDIQPFLDARKPGQNKFTTQRNEPDAVRILSGVFEGRTTGTSIGLLIENTDQRSKDYSEIAKSYRPGHADYAYDVKYGLRDYRGGGRSSARETAMRVAGRGAVARQVIPEVSILAYVPPRSAAMPLIQEISMPRRLRAIPSGVRTRRRRNAGRRWSTKRARPVRLWARWSNASPPAYPRGGGAPIYAKLDADLAAGMMSINAVKGVENRRRLRRGATNGRRERRRHVARGGWPRVRSQSCRRDRWWYRHWPAVTCRVAFKPTSSILTPVDSITREGEATQVRTKGRHDPCVGIRGTPVVEAMMALVLADHKLLHRAQCG